MRNTDQRGADERRVAHLLQRNGVGPDAAAPATVREPDWLDRLWQTIDEDERRPPAPAGDRIPPWWMVKQPLDGPGPDDELVPILTNGRDILALPPAASTAEPAAAVEDIGADSGSAPARWWTAAPGYYPAVHWPTVAAPMERAVLSAKTRRGMYSLSAAGAGYGLGLVQLLHGWIADCGGQFSQAGALVLGIGGCAALAHVWDRRTRHWWPALAWAARIPLASAVIALGLYAPGAV